MFWGLFLFLFSFPLFNAKKGAHGPHLQLVGTRIPAAPPSPARHLSPGTLHRCVFGHGALTKCCSSSFTINVLALWEQSRSFLGKMAFFYGQVTRQMTTQNMNTGESSSISQTGQLGPRGPFGAREEGGGSMAMGLVPGAVVLAWGRAHPHHLGGYKSLQPGWASASGCACTQSEGLWGLLKVPAMLLNWGGGWLRVHSSQQSSFRAEEEAGAHLHATTASPCPNQTRSAPRACSLIYGREGMVRGSRGARSKRGHYACKFGVSGSPVLPSARPRVFSHR